MTVFNVGDEVVYTRPYSAWVGTEGIVTEVLNSHGSVKIKLTKLVEGSRSYRLGEIVTLMNSKLELSYLKYDAAQQADEDDDV